MRFWRRCLVGLTAAAVVLLVGSPVGSGAPVSGGNVLYTLDADFDQGLKVNLNHDAPNGDQLQLNTASGTFPFIWVALSQRCTIAKIDTVSGAILGEYRTVSDNAGCAESSRTTVALDGSVWVGHRGPGGVTHVGLVELNQCIDRNGNGTIETSTSYGDVEAWPGSSSILDDASDECIINHVDTNARGLYDSRHMSIDRNNKLWVGDFAGGHNFMRFNGTTGAAETTIRSFSCGGYGGLIDSSGVIWSANGGSSGLLRWDPNLPDGESNPTCIPIPVYGIAIDGNGYVWVTALSGDALYKVSPEGGTVLGPFSHGSYWAQGLAVTPDGDVWVSASLFGGSTVGHVKNDGTFVGNVDLGSSYSSTGVSVDAAGKVWTANRSSNTATRIDPAAGPIGEDDVTPVGALDLTVSFPATEGRPLPYPYNYSDMTGAQLLSSTSPQGSWTITQDGGAAGTVWGKVIWNSEAHGSVPGGTSIAVEVRAADTEAALGSQSFAEVGNGAAFSAVGRFLEVRATLKPNDEGASPVLSDIRICDAASACAGGPAPAGTPPADIGVTKADAPDPVSVGQNVTYTIVVTNHGPGPAPDSALTDTLPAGVTFVSLATTRGSCTTSAGQVRCTFGTLLKGESATVTIVVRADQSGSIVNTAFVGSSAADPNVGNNQRSTAVTTVQGPFTPPTAPTGPTATGCSLSTGTSSVYAGIRTTIVVRARHDDGSAAEAVRVTLRGAGTRVAVTNASGVARLAASPARAGARITIRGASCGSALSVRAVASGNCGALLVTPKAVTVGSSSRIAVRVRIAGRPAVGVVVRARGAGITASGRTNSAGVAVLTGTAASPGVVTVTVPGVLTCSKRVGASGAFEPPKVTG